MATQHRAKKTGRAKTRRRPTRPKRKVSARPRRAAAKRAAARRPRPRSKPTPRPRPKPKAARRASEPRAVATTPNAIGATHQHMDYTSHALEEVRRFYAEVLGFRDVRYDENFQYVSVPTGPSSSVGFMPPMPGPPEQWRPPREPILYFQVADVDRAFRDLAAKGVTFLQEPTDMPWGHRVALLRDPEGRSIMLATPRPANRKGTP